MAPAVRGDDGQEVHHRVLVRRDGDLAAPEAAELQDRAHGVAAQVEQLLGVLVEDAARGGERAILRRAVDEGRADLALEALEGLAHGGLGPVQALGGGREALLLRDGEQHLELGQIHGDASGRDREPPYHQNLYYH